MSELIALQEKVTEIGYAVATYERIGGYTVGGFALGIPDLVVLTPPDEDGWFTHPALVLEPIMDAVRAGDLTLTEGLKINLQDLGSEYDYEVHCTRVLEETISALPHLHTSFPNPNVWRLIHDEDRGLRLDDKTFHTV